MNTKLKYLQSSHSSSDDTPSSDTSTYYSPTDYTDNDNELGCNDTCYKQVTFLTKSQQEKKSLIDLISKLENPKLKRQYTNKLKSLLINKDKKPSNEKPIISLNKTLERLKKEKHKDITLQDLHNEINQIKVTIKELKEKDISLEEEIAILRPRLGTYLFSQKVKKLPF